MRRYSVLLVLLFSSLFLITGCEKESEISTLEEITSENSQQLESIINEQEIKNFFSDDFLVKNNRFITSHQNGRSGGQINDLIHILKDDLSKDNESLMNVQSLINSLGYIDWSNYSLYQDDMGDQISFPVYKEQSPKVNGVMMFYSTDAGIKYFLTHRNKINSYLHDENWRSEYQNLYFSVLNLWDFDLQIFGRENKKLLTWLNENDPNENNFRPTTNGRSIECYTVWRCGSCPPGTHAIRDEGVSTRDWYECCSPTTYCDTYEPNIPPIGGGGTGGSGSTGGGSGGGTNPTDELPDYDGMSHTIKLGYLDEVYNFNNSEENFLSNNTQAIDAIYDAHNASVNNPNVRPQYMFEYIEDAIPTSDLVDVMVELAFLKLENPGWESNKILHSWLVVKASLNVALNKTHIILGTAGLIPGVGEVADFADAGIYFLQGDNENAIFSLAATVPFWGWTSRAHQAFKVVRTADGRKLTLWLKGDQNGIIRFTNGLGSDITNARNQLRKNLGIPSGSGTEAHHMIPWEHRTHELVQRAAENGKFHMNAKGNGFNLDITRHSDNHGLYNLQINNHMQALFDQNPGMNSQTAFNHLVDIQNSLRNQLNLGKSLSEITLP